MFDNASAFNGDLQAWNTFNVTTMEGMFQYAHIFNGDIHTWDVSNVTEMAGMFLDCPIPVLNKPPRSVEEGE